MSFVRELKDRVLAGGSITREEAIRLYDENLDELKAAATEIRVKFCGSRFDMCTIINGKSGKCSENCKFCSQSAHHNTCAEVYPLLSADVILEDAKRVDKQGVLRYSIVTSGRKLSDIEVDLMCDAVRKIKAETNLSVCVSFGLLNKEQFVKLKEAGVSRVHNNLETSEEFFSSICTTHKYEDKINSIMAAREAGLDVCSGGIFGLGETKFDRISMAFKAKELGVKSIPMNMLNPIPGTPLENNKRLTSEDMQRIIATFRFILPDGDLRLAGGRGLMDDKGFGCFEASSNAAITGDMLTTAGITVETDKEMLSALGYEVRFRNE